MGTPLLDIHRLSVTYRTAAGRDIPAVVACTFHLRQGEVYALVGESGCGKTTVVRAILRLLPRTAHVRGSIRFRGIDLLRLSESEMHRYRGRHIGVVFQEPGTALNPVVSIGTQLVETLQVHFHLQRDAAVQRALAWLERVALPDARHRFRAYPHELSGGMQQRVLLALALAGEPDILLADEPTTALDVTVQAQILELVRTLQRELGLTVLWITHDFGVVAEIADRVGVMYAGRIVEEGPVARIFAAPRHPYTQWLIATLPGRRPPRTRFQTIADTVSPLTDLPSRGCPFAPRCPEARPICRNAAPPTIADGPHTVVCWIDTPEYG